MKDQKKTVKVEVTKEDDSKQEVTIYVVRPTNNTIKNADRYRAKTWNQCVMDNILTKKELNKIMIDRGIWNETKESEHNSIIEEIQRLEKKLFIGDETTGKKVKISEGQKIAIEMRKLRVKLRELISERISMEENTAEALSDNAKFDYFVADCSFYENGQKIFSSIEDYNQKSSDEIAFAAASALAEILYQIDSNFEDSLPENVWLKDFNLVNKDLSLVNKDGQLVDLEGRRINENGEYIDEQGRRVDKYGNLLNPDGTYVLQVEYENDLSETTKEEKKKKKSET
jgi:hypothetical protein